MNYFNKILASTSNLFNKVKTSKFDMKFTIKGITKNPLKYIFYIISIILPFFSYILLDDLKIYTIVLLSFTTLLNYLNVCVFEKLCILKQQSC